jgi:hypothetical protein
MEASIINRMCFLIHELAIGAASRVGRDVCKRSQGNDDDPVKSCDRKTTQIQIHLLPSFTMSTKKFDVDDSHLEPS